MLDLSHTEGQEGAKTNALFNDSKPKFGVFGVNCDGGCEITLVDERHKLPWELTKKIAQTADRAGIEVMAPVARWKGLGGDINFIDRNLKTYIWSAALAAITEKITLTSTSHVQTTHPVFAAKQAATVDHISDGRYCLNVVCGWLEMFDVPSLEQDARYDYAEDWFSINKRLRAEEEEFSHHGEYFGLDGAFAMLRPLQRPLFTVINAGGSEKGRNFIAPQCDIGYIVITDHNDLEAILTLVDQYRSLAREKYGREVPVWTHAYVVQRDTDKEAHDCLQHFAADSGNDDAADMTTKYLELNSKMMPPEAWGTFKFHLKDGHDDYGFVGSAEAISKRLAGLSEVGIDGIAIHWVDYLDGLNRFNADVMPLLEKAGLRKPFSKI